jgi:hypothetical protein
MANFIEVQSSIVVQFTADTNLVASPITLVCNRQYELVDYNINVTAGNGDNGVANTGTRITIDNYTAAGVIATALGTVNSSLLATTTVGTWQRPATVTIAGLGVAVTNALIQGAVVPRGNVLRIGAAASTGGGDATVPRAQGTIRALPGNRYSAVTSPTAYYANNLASGAQGSSATQSI